ncbi:MAG: antitoxin [Candidatus Aminicenantes bacterium]|nr:antitoxin [Candidatus Aminicenantes bacterium]
MKLSICLCEEEVHFLDDYARTRGFKSRSAVVRAALYLLRTKELARDYAAAWDEWDGGNDADAWDRSTSDGLNP